MASSLGRALVSASMVALAASHLALAGASPTHLVLRTADMSKGYALIADAHLSADAAAELSGLRAAQLRGWGFRAAYKVLFLGRLGTSSAAVGSAVSVYASAAGASTSVSNTASTCNGSVVKQIVMRELGHPGYLCTTAQRSNGVTTTIYEVVWAQGGFRELVSIATSGSPAARALALRLAVIQARRAP